LKQLEEQNLLYSSVSDILSLLWAAAYFVLQGLMQPQVIIHSEIIIFVM
jgi:hypothetical protein